MNALQPMTTPQPAGLALVPTNINDALRFADVMAKAGFLARELQTPGGALFVIEQAMRWNMSPFAVAMETSFIQGKPMFSGKIVAAAIQSAGVLHGRLRYDYEGSGDNRTVTVSGTLAGESEARTVTVRVGDAKTNNKVWQSQPDQQLAYHGARVWARRYAPEVMLGVWAPEEFDAPQEAPREVPNLAPQPTPRAPVVDEEELPILTPDGRMVPVRASVWPRAIAKALAGLESLAAVSAWHRDMAPLLDSISERHPILAAEAETAIEARKHELTINAEDAA